MSELSRKRQLEEKGGRLKRLVAELSCDKQILQKTLQESGDAYAS